VRPAVVVLWCDVTEKPLDKVEKLVASSSNSAAEPFLEVNSIRLIVAPFLQKSRVVMVWGMTISNRITSTARRCQTNDFISEYLMIVPAGDIT
jgi:hypothetical protein